MVEEEALEPWIYLKNGKITEECKLLTGKKCWEVEEVTRI